jgi:hypothetical protein
VSAIVRDGRTALGRTWLEPEEWTYPSGGFLRRAYVRLRANQHAPFALQAPDVGTYRTVRASIPDTYFSIPARLRLRGRTVRGFVSVIDEEFTFTPEAA